MKALVYTAPEELALQERPAPSPAPGQVKLRVLYTGICGSDLHGYLGTTGRRIPPMVMGHEFSAEVEETGPGVTKCKPGDRVTVQPILYCGECAYCKQGLVNICANREFLGTMSTDGAFVEALCVHEDNIVHLPQNVSEQAGAMIEPLAVALRAVRAAGALEGKTILVSGAGTIGLLVMMVANHLGAGRVIMADLSDYRLGLAKQFGAAGTVNPKNEDMGEALAAVDVDITIECVGATPTVQQSINYLRNKGTAVWVGNSAKMVEVDMQQIVTRELTVKGTYIYTAQDFADAVALLAESGLPVEKLVSKVVGLHQAKAAFDELLTPGTELIKVLVDCRRGEETL